MNEYKVTILGAGLAGCEAALWLAGKGVQVELYEQKPVHFSPAHKSEGFAELICSNSLKAERLDSASGLLKEEMRRMGSRLLTAAEETRVAAGGALAVDRDAFSAAVTRMVEQCENITVHREQVETIDESAPILVATGPLTDGALADEIGRLTGDERLHFYDAVAPIVTAESLDYGKVRNVPPCTILTPMQSRAQSPTRTLTAKRPIPSPCTRAVCPLRSWLPGAPTPCGLARCARWVW